MLRFLPKARPPLRILMALMSFVLFAYMIWQAGPSKLLDNVAKLGWGFMWVLALAGVWQVAGAGAWRLKRDHHMRRPSFLPQWGLRVRAERLCEAGVIGPGVEH